MLPRVHSVTESGTIDIVVMAWLRGRRFPKVIVVSLVAAEAYTGSAGPTHKQKYRRCPMAALPSLTLDL